MSTLVSTSVAVSVLPVPHGPKVLLGRRSAALGRSALAARRTTLVSRPHNSHLRARTAWRTRPERAARNESGQAPPTGPERCSRTIATTDGDLRPLLPRRCTPCVGCRDAVQRRTSAAVLTKQTKSSVPDCGSQLKAGPSVLRPSRAWVTCVGHGVEALHHAWNDPDGCGTCLRRGGKRRLIVYRAGQIINKVHT